MFKRSEFPALLDVNRALQHVQRALELEPHSGFFFNFFAFFLFFAFSHKKTIFKKKNQLL